MTEWGLMKYKEAKPSNGGAFTLETTNDPVITRCAPPGVPRIYFHPFPIEFIPTAKYIAVLYEYDHMVRRIYTDGRPMPKDPDPSWLGYSIGHWDNDTTFVVETAGFNDKTLARPGLGHAHRHRAARDRGPSAASTTTTWMSTSPWWIPKPWPSRGKPRSPWR